MLQFKEKIPRMYEVLMQEALTEINPYIYVINNGWNPSNIKKLKDMYIWFKFNTEWAHDYIELINDETIKIVDPLCDILERRGTLKSKFKTPSLNGSKWRNGE